MGPNAPQQPGPEAEPVGGSLVQRLDWLRHRAVESEDEHHISPKVGTTEVGHTTIVMVLEYIDALKMPTPTEDMVPYLREKVGLALMELRNVPSVLLDGRGRVNLTDAIHRLEEALEGTNV